MRRRRFLAAVAAAASVAGCGGDGDGGDPLETDTDAPTPTATSTAAPTRTPTATPTEGETTRSTTRQAAADGTVRIGVSPAVAEDYGDRFGRLLHEAGLSTDVEVELVGAAAGRSRRRQRYEQFLAAGEDDLDLLVLPHIWLQGFREAGYLANLTAALPSSTLDRAVGDAFDPLARLARAPDGGDVYAVPAYFDVPTMLYRRSWVEQAGFDPTGENWATEPMSWAAWSRVAERTASAAGADHGFAIQWDDYVGTACCTFNETLTAFGGAFFGGRDTLYGPVGGRPVTVDEDPVLRSLAMLRRFVHGESSDLLDREYATNIAPLQITRWTEEPARKRFANGDAAFLRNWPYAIEIHGEGDALGRDLGAMPLPAGVPESEARYPGTGGSAAALGAWHVALNPNAGNRAAAVEVLRAMTTDAFALAAFAAAGWLPTRPSLYDAGRARNVEPLGRYLDTLRVAARNAIPRPITPVWETQSPVVAREANTALQPDASAADAMDRLARRLASIEDGA